MAKYVSLLRSIVSIPYDLLIRPCLPERIAVCNGVPARVIKLFDIRDTFPEYEEPLIKGIRQHGRDGDTVVHVGGGNGPSAVASARRVEPSGEVIVYEGGEEYAKKVRETAVLNGVEGIISVHRAIVGEARDVWGDSSNVETLPPSSIPECDLLVMDCEGAEQVILPSLQIEPDTIVVESHGELGSPTEDVREKLVKLGYDILDVSAEVPEEDVYVITATK